MRKLECDKSYGEHNILLDRYQQILENEASSTITEHRPIASWRILRSRSADARRRYYSTNILEQLLKSADKPYSLPKASYESPFTRHRPLSDLPQCVCTDDQLRPKIPINTRLGRQFEGFWHTDEGY